MASRLNQKFPIPTQKDIPDMSRSNSITFTDKINAKKGEPKPVEELPPQDINGLQ